MVSACAQTEAHFSNFFLAKILGKPVIVDDLHSLDAELFRHLLSLKSLDGSVEDLGLHFAVRGGAPQLAC
jgi:ubiquitin-protein ligase E3 C